jgi:hypothetical protein
MGVRTDTFKALCLIGITGFQRRTLLFCLPAQRNDKPIGHALPANRPIGADAGRSLGNPEALGEDPVKKLALIGLSLAVLGIALPISGQRGQAASGPATRSASGPASRESRSSLKPESFEIIEVKLSPAAILGGAEPNAPGNAADDYRKAIEVCKANADPIADAMDRMDELSAGKYKLPPAVMKALETILDHVSAGAAKREMQSTTPQDLAVRYADDRAARLARVSEALVLLVNAYYSAKDYERLEKTLRAKLVLGWHMAGEHVRATMCLQGLEIQTQAAGAMLLLYGKWEKEDRAAVLKAVGEYEAAVRKASRAYRGKFSQVWKATPKPDDVFAVLDLDKDRAWRVEALLLCGVIRFTHTEDAGVQKAVAKLMQTCANDKDPYVKAAAAAAAGLTKKAFEYVGDPAER